MLHSGSCTVESSELTAETLSECVYALLHELIQLKSRRSTTRRKEKHLYLLKGKMASSAAFDYSSGLSIVSQRIGVVSFVIHHLYILSGKSSFDNKKLAKESGKLKENLHWYFNGKYQ